MVVFFDEFQEVATASKPYGDPDRLTKRMRAIFQRSEGVSYLFAGSIEHLMRDLFVPSQRALHQFGAFHQLRPIDAEAWAEGLSARFAADDCTIGAAALTRIVELGELHPRATMLIAQKTHLTSVLLDTREIMVDLVEQGYLAALEGERASNEQSIERIRQVHRLGLEVARRIANGETVYSNLSRGAVRRALEDLRDAAIIESHGRGDWRLTNPLLKRYLRDSARFSVAAPMRRCARYGRKMRRNLAQHAPDPTPPHAGTLRSSRWAPTLRLTRCRALSTVLVSQPMRRPTSS